MNHIESFVRFILLACCAFSFQRMYSQQIEFWGATSEGGNDFGTIFKTDGNGENLEFVHVLGLNPGFVPFNNPTLCANGKLYGTTLDGGENKSGILFEYVPGDSVIHKLVDFNKATTGWASTRLIETGPNVLFGMFSGGQINSPNEKGAIYRYDVVLDSFQVLFSFDLHTTGGSPQNGFCKDNNGMLYGTLGVGPGGSGLIFKFNPITSQFNIIHQFSGTTDGEAPNGLCFDSTKYLYGSTRFGGSQGLGILFRYDLQNNSFQKLADFDTSIGKNPVKTLVMGKNGRIYGVTVLGGNYNAGVLFEYDTLSHNLIKIKDFGIIGQVGGNAPSDPISGMNGHIYGLNDRTGQFQRGELYEYDPDLDIYSTVYHFKDFNDLGYKPVGLVEVDTGFFYGLADGGGVNNWGVLFSYNEHQTLYQKVLSFHDETSGGHIVSSLTDGKDGSLYGVCLDGGTFHRGAIFSLNRATKEFSIRHSFGGWVGDPVGFQSNGLLLASDGLFYGTSNTGGKFNRGAMYVYDRTDDSVRVLFNFSDSSGANPSADLIEVPGNGFYGTTFSGGQYGMGTVFNFNPGTMDYEIVHSFYVKDSLGGGPMENLTYNGSGKLYGSTQGGGIHNDGVLFEIDLATKKLNKLVDFERLTKGKGPIGNLVLHPNGLIYGATYDGSTDNGTLYSYDPSSNQFDQLETCIAENNVGNNFKGLMRASNGNIYGLSVGRDDLKGILYEFNPVLNTLSVKQRFDHQFGSQPKGGLIEVNGWVGIQNQSQKNDVVVFPNPFKEQFTVQLTHNDQSAVFNLLNANGQIVRSWVSYGKQKVFDASSLSSGLYFLQIISRNAQHVVKLMKE